MTKRNQILIICLIGIICFVKLSSPMHIIYIDEITKKVSKNGKSHKEDLLNLVVVDTKNGNIIKEFEIKDIGDVTKFGDSSIITPGPRFDKDKKCYYYIKVDLKSEKIEDLPLYCIEKKGRDFWVSLNEDTIIVGTPNWTAKANLREIWPPDVKELSDILWVVNEGHKLLLQFLFCTWVEKYSELAKSNFKYSPSSLLHLKHVIASIDSSGLLSIENKNPKFGNVWTYPVKPVAHINPSGDILGICFIDRDTDTLQLCLLKRDDFSVISRIIDVCDFQWIDDERLLIERIELYESCKQQFSIYNYKTKKKQKLVRDPNITDFAYDPVNEELIYHYEYTITDFLSTVVKKRLIKYNVSSKSQKTLKKSKNRIWWEVLDFYPEKEKLNNEKSNKRK